ncbi:MAG: tRNA epoxyqueuosine(34) reductase QueG [Elusimicrobia bacterium]|nr:tRNA epoxyqueuosine(34) reductase QueG [Elusimicrobiota bacterium]
MNQAANELSLRLRRQAIASGADLVGIAPAKPLPEASAYQRWIEAGMQAGMDYMARNEECRLDITRWYEQARSVLICGFSYASNSPAPDSDADQGRFARYSALPDYHPELKKRMLSILDWLKRESPGADGRAFVDTSPLLERLYARYAGVGWVGKNAMLISPRKGSYFLIAGLALNLELECDEPEPEHCGSCNRCIEACPTEAFVEPKVLDASRCVAYFTIEHRGAIPEGFRPGIGSWVMGCDICQEVCPWNRFARRGPAFGEPAELSLPLEQLAGLSPSDFRRRFADTPVSRAKHKGLLRNALLAMGNSGNPAFRPALERFRQDPDPVLREQAEWSLARLPVDGQS